MKIIHKRIKIINIKITFLKIELTVWEEHFQLLLRKSTSRKDDDDSCDNNPDGN